MTRILIVDDNRTVCRYLIDLLKNQEKNIVISCAHDGFEVGRNVHLHRPNIILLDLRMPGMDGFDVCQKLKADPDTRGIRIIAMTGQISRENRNRMLKAGAEVCLAKPIDSKLLLQHIDTNKSNSAKEISGGN